jgi:hypothetical protein
MTKASTSIEAIRTSILSRLSVIACCGAVNDVDIEVNWERTSGMTNWWVTRIRFQRAPFPPTDIAASTSVIARIEHDLQASWFIVTDDGFSRGLHV